MTQRVPRKLRGDSPQYLPVIMSLFGIMVIALWWGGFDLIPAWEKTQDLPSIPGLAVLCLYALIWSVILWVVSRVKHLNKMEMTDWSKYIAVVSIVLGFAVLSPIQVDDFSSGVTFALLFSGVLGFLAGGAQTIRASKVIGGICGFSFGHTLALIVALLVSAPSKEIAVGQVEGYLIGFIPGFVIAMFLGSVLLKRFPNLQNKVRSILL